MSAETGRKSRRAEIRLTAEEADAFLAANRKVQVATVGRDGAPHLSTLFYAVVGGRLAFWTYASAQKTVNLRRDPRITCLIDDGDEYARLRGLVLYGTAELAEGPEAVLRVGTAVSAAMTGTPIADLQGPDAQAGIAHAGRKRVAVFVDVDRTVSWDHRKL